MLVRICRHRHADSRSVQRARSGARCSCGFDLALSGVAIARRITSQRAMAWWPGTKFEGKAIFPTPCVHDHDRLGSGRKSLDRDRSLAATTPPPVSSAGRHTRNKKCDASIRLRRGRVERGIICEGIYSASWGKQVDGGAWQQRWEAVESNDDTWLSC